jgi:hypothetical protein
MAEETTEDLRSKIFDKFDRQFLNFLNSNDSRDAYYNDIVDQYIIALFLLLRELYLDMDNVLAIGMIELHLVYLAKTNESFPISSQLRGELRELLLGLQRESDSYIAALDKPEIWDQVAQLMEEIRNSL